MSATIAVISCGIGNIRSVVNAFEYLGCKVVVAEAPALLHEADAVVLPGVGAFKAGMANLQAGGWIPALEQEVLGSKKPFLGICLGMQLLATEGFEGSRTPGLGWIEGQVRELRFDGDALRLPHIGWNNVTIPPHSVLYQKLGGEADFYFVHSYAIYAESAADDTRAYCDYGGRFLASVERENVCGVQFHPERSHKAGLKLLGNFAAMANRS